MGTKPWKVPQDPARSLRVRTEGLMRKCMDLTKLGVRVALYIEKVDDGKAFCYKTHPDLEPSWNEPGPQPRATSQTAMTPQPANKQGTATQTRSSPSIPDLDSLRLAWPSTGKTSPLKPNWDDLEIVRIGPELERDLAPVNPAPQVYQNGPRTAPASRKRPRPASPDGLEESPRKRERSTSWFDY
ncbi:hypothetical protein B0T10DRAFT_593442 [Thelonectria olida]|uniref:Uncharacterized protein n=1 Tax=Thelonectria olida TaxID=1576542 RepID=A0A9P8VPP7_9HYPO|nr:hypothetical protein B0T10DRAFT_593442 [Thelonectria olida]